MGRILSFFPYSLLRQARQTGAVPTVYYATSQTVRLVDRADPVSEAKILISVVGDQLISSRCSLEHDAFVSQGFSLSWWTSQLYRRSLDATARECL